MHLVSVIAITFVLALTFVRVSSVQVPAERAPRDPALDDLMFTDHIVLEARARSKLECGRLCASTFRCIAFTWYGGNQCRGHKVLMTMSSSNIASVGARSYMFPELGALGPTECVTVNDCPMRVNHLTCFYGQCLCEPGYYNSISAGTCLAQCPVSNRAYTFIKYVEWRIVDFNLKVIHNMTLTQCKASCIQEPNCVTIEHQDIQFLECHLAVVTVLDVDPQKWERNLSYPYDYYQRECA